MSQPTSSSQSPIGQTIEMGLLQDAAMQHYSFGAIIPRFIGHGENLTYCLQTTSGEPRYLLRIHYPKEGRRYDEWRNPAVIESEGMWLSALARDTNTSVQQPVLNRLGEFVTLLTLKHRQYMPVTVLHWLPGEPQDRSIPRSPELAYRLGKLLGILHTHGKAWRCPREFYRPKQSIRQIDANIEHIRPLVETGVITGDDFSTFERAVRLASALLIEDSKQERQWGLIHGDLSESNYVIYNGELQPIDFTNCCYGSYLYDICATLQHVRLPERNILMEGYRSVRPLEGISQKDMESYFVLGLAIQLGHHAQDQAEYPYLSRALPFVAAKYCSMLLDDQPFLFLDDL